MNELTKLLAQSRAKDICALLARELSTSKDSEMVAMLVGETLLKEAVIKIAATDGMEAAQRRLLAFQIDVSEFVLMQPPPPARRLDS